MSFKVKIINKPGDHEIRRFDLDESNISLEILKKKLVEIVPELEKKTYLLKWHDEDNDAIIIECDAELQSAMKTMFGSGVFKLLVKVVQPKPANDRSKVVHEGITCDNCMNEVKGFRYKCVICPDFDLCQVCESNGGNIHEDHNMIRIANPTKVWPKHFFKRVNKLHEKMMANRQARQQEKALASLTQGSSWLSFGAASNQDNQPKKQEQVNTKCEKPENLDNAEDIIEDDDEEQQSLEDVFQQLSVHGADYLKNLGTMITEALDNLVPDEDAVDEHKKNDATKDAAAENTEIVKEKNDEEKKEKNDFKDVEIGAYSGSTMQDALDSLINMGFTNEGGWLSQLLEAKNGDVEQTLDAIKPKAKAE